MKKFKPSIEEINAQSNMDEYIKQCAERLAKQIDFDLMCQLFPEWTVVEVDNDPGLFDWVYNNANIKGGAYGFEGRWSFELESDANWFVLRWQQ
jgi:hypothetical protein